MIHRLVPSFILQRDAVGQHQGSFPAVGLFVDISGFSQLTDGLMNRGQHGAEVLSQVMRAVMGPLIAAVFEQGGFVTTQPGDAFTALFPVDALEQAPLRALAAAWKIQQHMAAQPTQATPYGAFTMTAKAGLALGHVTWGIVSAHDGRRANYYFHGTTIDGCANAEHQARAGDIVLDAALYNLARARIAAQPLGAYFRVSAVGADLPPPLPAEPLAAPLSVDLDRAGRFFPRALWLEPRSGEFRQVVHLFVSLPTLRGDTQLERFMQTVFMLLDRYGGLLSQLDFGDKGANLLIIWGVPTAYENDVDRALSFVLELQSQTEIPISGGVTYRIAHCGYIGGDQAEQFAPYGRGVNLAARFMTRAPRGEIWVDGPAVARAQARFVLERLSEMVFKGFAQPQLVYLLQEQKETAPLTDASHWVGRENELAALMEFVQPIFARGGAGAMVVWGEPGIGKSRLVLQFLHGLRQQHPACLVAWAQSDEILRAALNPFSYWLRSYLGLAVAATEARNKRSFNRKLDELIAAIPAGPLAAELDRTRSFLGALVGLLWPDSLFEQVDTAARYENTLIALATLLQAESRRQPVLLVLEDAHWLDEDSKAFLPRLLRTLTADDRAAYPIALVLTARFEGAGLPLAEFPRTDLFLSGLNRATSAAQAQAHLGAPAGASLLDRLVQDAQGNPFFAEQILIYLRDAGRLELIDGVWQLAAAGDELLPGDVNAVLVARLDRLTQEVRAVVQTAAVLGREFEVRLLADMLRAEPRLPDTIAEAERQAIWSALNALRHIFRHALLRDAAYHMQVHSRRRALHALAAEALARLYADDLAPHTGELAYHAEQAGLADQACRYLGLAGQMAASRYQNGAAVDYFSRALALTPPESLRERYDLLAAREAVYTLQARQPERQADLAAMQGLALELGETSPGVEVTVRQAALAAAQGNYRESTRLADEAAAQALAAGLTAAAVAAYFSAADGLRRQGDYGLARQRAMQGLTAARALKLTREEASLLNLLGMLQLEQKDLHSAADYFQQSLALYRSLGDRRGQAMPLNNLGNLSGYQGDYAAAERYFAQSLDIAREIGHRAGESLVLNNLGWIAGLQGDAAQARAHAEQNLRLARETGDRLSETYGLINLSAHAGALGDSAAALSSARRALELSRQDHDRSAEAWAQTYLGFSLAAGADHAGALGAYQAALDIRVALGQPVLATEPGAGRARLLLAGGDTAAALAQVETILAVLQGDSLLEGTDAPLRVYLTCYLVLSAAQDARAQTILQAAHGLLQARAAAIADDPARRHFLDGVADHRAILQAWQQSQTPAGD